MKVKILINKHDQPVINFSIVGVKWFKDLCKINKFIELKPMLSNGLCEENNYKYFIFHDIRQFVAVRKGDELDEILRKRI